MIYLYLKIQFQAIQASRSLISMKEKKRSHFEEARRNHSEMSNFLSDRATGWKTCISISDLFSRQPTSPTLVIRSFLRNDSFLPRLGDQRILRPDPDTIRDSGKSDRSRSIRSYEQLDRDYKDEKEGRPPARFARNTMNSKARRGVLLFRY